MSAQSSLSTTLRPITLPLKIFLLAHAFSTYVYHINETTGPSMLPTLQTSHDRVLISRHYRRGRDIKVGDVVEFRHPIVPGEGAVKRVVGLGGDFVLRDGYGSGPGPGQGSGGGLEEHGFGVRRQEMGKQEMIQVPAGHCWLAGDNLPWSRDSRTYGPIPLALIKGKVVAKVWPWRERAWIENGLVKVADGHG